MLAEKLYCRERKSLWQPFVLLLAGCTTFLFIAHVAAGQSHRDEVRINHTGRTRGFVPAHLKKARDEAETLRAVPPQDQQPFMGETHQIDNQTMPASFIHEPADVTFGGLEGFEQHQPAINDVGCNDGTCGRCCGAVRPGVTGRVEYLLWWTSGFDTPPLATTSPAGTGQSEAGVLGQPGTSVLFGDGDFITGARSGGRYTMAFWCDACQNSGWEVSYMSLGNGASTFSASNTNVNILARPFFNEITNVQDARLIAFPAVVDGGLNINLSTEFDSLEALYRCTAQRSSHGRMEYLLGYRFAQLDDRVNITESTLSLTGATAGAFFDLQDEFTSRNEFHGGVIGIACQWQPNPCWSFEFIGKLALGKTQRQATVVGRTVASAGGASLETPIGLLAQDTNIGTYNSDQFTTVTEFGISLKRQFNHRLGASLGYSFVYWNDVSRAGDQIDFGINTSQIPPGMLTGAARPAFAFRSTDFWAQGIRFGVEYTF